MYEARERIYFPGESSYAAVFNRFVFQRHKLTVEGRLEGPGAGSTYLDNIALQIQAGNEIAATGTPEGYGRRERRVRRLGGVLNEAVGTREMLEEVRDRFFPEWKLMQVYDDNNAVSVDMGRKSAYFERDKTRGALQGYCLVNDIDAEFQSVIYAGLASFNFSGFIKGEGEPFSKLGLAYSQSRKGLVLSEIATAILGGDDSHKNFGDTGRIILGASLDMPPSGERSVELAARKLLNDNVFTEGAAVSLKQGAAAMFKEIARESQGKNIPTWTSYYSERDYETSSFEGIVEAFREEFMNARQRGCISIVQQRISAALKKLEEMSSLQAEKEPRIIAAGGMSPFIRMSSMFDPISYPPVVIYSNEPYNTAE